MGSSDWLKPMRNAGIVGAGKGVQGLMSFGYMAFAARALGVEAFGYLVLIHAFVFGASQVLRLQSWQAVLRYGAHAIEKKDQVRLGMLIRFCGRADIFAAIFGLLLVQVFMTPASQLIDLPQDFVIYARFYGLAIVFMILNPTQLGILRLFDKFHWIAIQTNIEALVRFVGGLVLWLSGQGLAAFIVLWFSACIVSRIVLLVMARMVLIREGFVQNEKAESWINPFKEPEDGIWWFMLSHNFSRAAVACQPHVALFMVGAILGPVAAGLFRIAQQVSDVLVKPSHKFLVPAIYPELAKMQAKNQDKARREMVIRNITFVAAIAFSVFLVLVLAGQILIMAFAGAPYAGAYEPMLILAVAGLLMTLSFPLEPILSAAGRMRDLVVAQGTGLFVYMISLYLLGFVFGLNGMALASVVAISVSAFMMWYFARDLLGKGASK